MSRNAHIDATRSRQGRRVWAYVPDTLPKEWMAHLDHIVLEDGSLVIPPEKLKQFGGGHLVRGRRELRSLIESQIDRPIKQEAGPVSRPENVRIANAADADAIFALLMQDVQENAAMIALPDEARIRSHIKNGVNLQGNVIGVIDGPDKRPIAATVLVPLQWWWSREWFYQDLVLYIHPDHRRYGYLDDLIRFQQWAADHVSVLENRRVYLITGVLGLFRVATKIVRYRRMLKQVGAVFLHPWPFGDAGQT